MSEIESHQNLDPQANNLNQTTLSNLPGSEHYQSFVEAPPTTIARVQGTNIYEITGTKNTDQHDLLYSTNKETSAAAIERLTRLLVTVGVGTHSTTRLSEASGIENNVLWPTINPLSNALPSSILTKNADGSFTLGDFKVATRFATPEDKEKLNRMKHEKTQAHIAKAMEELVEAESQKTDITTFDHAIITKSNGDMLHVPLINREAILAVRVLRILPEHNEQKIASLAKEIWKSMPINERELWVEDEKIANTRASAIERPSVRALTTIISPVGLAHSAWGTWSIHDSFTTELIENPPETRYNPQVKSIFPCDTPLEVRRQYEFTAEPQASAEAIEAVQQFLTPDWHKGLSPQSAIGILDLITSKEGRQAFEVACTQQEQPLPFTESYEAVLDKIKATLGDTVYKEAKKARQTAIEMRPEGLQANEDPNDLESAQERVLYLNSKPRVIK